MDAVENECNDTPMEIPIFSLLSPQHRTFLVSKLAVGLLCEEEPLPPQTIEYAAAYAGVVATILCELEVEIDTCGDIDIGQDLIELYYDPFVEEERIRREEYRTTTQNRDQRCIDMKLIGRAAEKNRKMLERKNDKQRERGGNKFARETRNDKGIIDMDRIQNHLKRHFHIFEGGKCPEDIRRPPRPLTKDELGWGGFNWRLATDKALQEETTRYTEPSMAMMNIYPTLSEVNFCWNCFDRSKWITAVNFLMHTKYAIVNDRDSALIHGSINDLAFADKTKHNRILAVQKAVKDMRDGFDSQFDVKKGAYPQRMIFAVCAEEFFHGRGHYTFATKFVKTCKERGISLKDGGNFQKRYKVFQIVSEQVPEGLELGYVTGSEFTSPVDYKSEDLLFFECCEREGCYSFSDKELKLCSNCRVVKYCSKECQKTDWKKHKMLCKTLAATRKDKNKLQEVINNF